MSLPANIQRTIEAFGRLPGIGPKTAERLTFHLLQKPQADIQQMGQTIARLKEGIGYCKVCQNLTENDQCHVCLNPQRDPSTICVVETALDLLALEKISEYKGVYHVLHGIISPMDGIGPDELTIAELVERVKNQEVTEMIMALNPSIEGEATMAYMMRFLQPLGIKVTYLARGIPVGGNLEYADRNTLKRAFEGRREY